MKKTEIKKLDEDKAVSPVIATILMVAITVVLAGVLYVWANNLASEGTDTSIGTFNTYTTEDAEDLWGDRGTPGDAQQMPSDRREDRSCETIRSTRRRLQGLGCRQRRHQGRPAGDTVQPPRTTGGKQSHDV